jgi:RHS repeat-associated protein
VVSFGHDDLGRANRVESVGKEYIKSVTYEDHGGMKEIRKNGYVLRKTFGYSAGRLQLTGITVAHCTDGALCAAPNNLLDLGFTYQTTASGGNGSGPNNNGNVFTQRIQVPGAFDMKQSYGYDAWNRLETFNEAPFAGGAATLNEKYCHDAHGNHAVEARAGVAAGVLLASPCTAAAVSAVFPLNRINMSAYDAAGGLAADHRSNMRYDAGDRLAKTWPLAPAGAAATTYEYDADGRRVALKAPGNVTTTFVYDAFGKLAAEYGGIAVGTSGTAYFSQDHLGSTRLVTDAAGAPVRRFDYWPFGMELFGTDTSYRTAALGYGTGSNPVVRFTGKERDGETGLDYFGARYMSGAQGRFTSPDPLLSSGRPWDPQSWNRYAYVLNNPLRYTDPLGLYVWDGSLGGDTSDDEVRKNYAKKQANQIIGRRNDIRGALAAGAKINDPRVQAAIGAYGAEGAANGVAVAMGKLSGNTAAQVSPGSPPVLASADGASVTANMLVTFDFSKVSGENDLVVNAAHEGQHMLDRQTFIGSTLTDPNAFSGPLNLTTYQTEVNAYTTGAAAFRALNPNSGYAVGGQLLWNPGWAAVDRQALDKMLAVPKPKGSYGVTPQNPGSVLYPK